MTLKLENIPYLFFCLVILVSGCTSIAPAGKTDQLDKVLVLKKDPCFGQCPVFTLTLYENGQVDYLGEQNVEKIGLFTKKMNINDLRKLAKKFRDGGFFDFENVYRSAVPDLQTVSITFNDNGNSKTVVGKSEDRPEAIIELQQLLEEIANTEGDWKAQKQKSNSKVLPDGTITNELLIQLVEGVIADQWISKYASSGAKLVESLSRYSNYWLISFNDETTNPQEFLENIRNDREVVGAEFNKQINNW